MNNALFIGLIDGNWCKRRYLPIIHFLFISAFEQNFKLKVIFDGLDILSTW